ncbi:DUF1127 domain-containing protein [Rhizobium sp. EC-SD404]|uniref:DUF1127 domain-containing protein n=1 Tax=Rhizobium sp. EC-SD404 TaxID=2038389 RepID=UPI0012514BFA|nr:DUF1127 domain-containing protein [Rhizobium sp. EC-SD404]VVT16917.1 conserved hypothetical protein [Rhizobium sp. EC-SD404]
MKTIETRPDLDIAPARITASVIAKAMAFRLLTVFRALRNRKQVMYLEDFTEEQLADIGLTRGDLLTSLESPWYDDPSQHLSRSVWQRRSRIRPRA